MDRTKDRWLIVPGLTGIVLAQDMAGQQDNKQGLMGAEKGRVSSRLARCPAPSHRTTPVADAITSSVVMTDVVAKIHSEVLGRAMRYRPPSVSQYVGADARTSPACRARGDDGAGQGGAPDVDTRWLLGRGPFTVRYFFQDFASSSEEAPIWS